MEGSSVPTALEPSRIRNMEVLGKVCRLAGLESNEWGRTAIEIGSSVVKRRTGTSQPIFSFALTVGLVAMEFLRGGVAPLQKHMRPTWLLDGPYDPMQLSSGELDGAALAFFSKELFPGPADMAPTGDVRPLYLRS